MSFKFQTEPVDEFESVLGVFYGNRGQWGQQFVVTNRRLLLGPLDVGLAEEILGHALDVAGVPDVDFARSILSKYAPRDPKTIWLRHVVDIQSSNRAGLFKAPGLTIQTDTHEVIDLGIVHKPTGMNISPLSTHARDSFVQLLREAVAAAKAAPAPGN